MERRTVVVAVLACVVGPAPVVGTLWRQGVAVMVAVFLLLVVVDGFVL